MTKPTKILLYAVNGLGMGHIARQLAIAKFLRRYLWLAGKHPEVFFLSTSEVDSLPYKYDFPVVKIPSKSIIAQGGLDAHRYQKMAKMMIWNCISALDPDVLVVDTFPGGAFEELYDVMNFGFRKAFIYRPRKDRSRLWRNPILKAYDKILYIDESHEADWAESEAEGSLAEKIGHFGAIVQYDRREMMGAAEARKMLGLSPDRQTICLMAGGGGDKNNHDFFARMLPILASFEGLEVVVAAGPLYKGAEIPLANGRWFYRNDLSLFLNAFDAAISAGGFNSVNELLHAQIPTIFFAQNRLYDDQEARLKSLTEMGLCCSFSLEQNDPEIRDALSAFLEKDRRMSLSKALQNHDLQNEADDAALFILEMVMTEAEVARAERLMDMQLIQNLLRKGLSERTICKTISALATFADQCEAMEDEGDVLQVAKGYLETALVQKLPPHQILPFVFEAIKGEGLTSLDDLMNHLMSQLAKPYYEV